jgi:hypothetical protein
VRKGRDASSAKSGEASPLYRLTAIHHRDPERPFVALIKAAVQGKFPRVIPLTRVGPASDLSRVSAAGPGSLSFTGWEPSARLPKLGRSIATSRVVTELPTIRQRIEICLDR